jgi:hypothetical protein
MRKLITAAFILSLTGACSPEIGSDDWCKSLKEKKKADWSAREIKDYAKHCLFK